MKRLSYTENGVEWEGAEFGEGDRGRYMFGRDAGGNLHIEIVCDHKGPYHNETGAVANRVSVEDGLVIARWLVDFLTPFAHEE